MENNNKRKESMLFFFARSTNSREKQQRRGVNSTAQTQKILGASPPLPFSGWQGDI